LDDFAANGMQNIEKLQPLIWTHPNNGRHFTTAGNSRQKTPVVEGPAVGRKESLQERLASI
jgi:hypothetical protein